MASSILPRTIYLFLKGNVVFSKRGPVGRCVQCRSFYSHSYLNSKVSPTSGEIQFHVNHASIPETCRLCSSRVELCGPMWLGQLHCRDFVKKVLSLLQQKDDNKNLGTLSRIIGFLTVISEVFFRIAYCNHDLGRKSKVRFSILFRKWPLS